MGKRWITAAIAGLGLALVLSPVTAGATPPAHATLVRTHVFEPGPSVLGAHGKPQPSVANCSPDDSSQYGTTPTYTGFKSTVSVRDAHFNATTAPAGLTTATADVQAAFNEWSATGEPAAPDFLVTTAAPVVTSATANRHTDVLFGRTQGNAIAVTYTWRWSDTNEYESDTVFNSRLAWAEISTAGADGCDENAGAVYDFQNIATHEFGHIYGLDHPPGDRFATMYKYGYTGETLKRSLATSDTTGIQSLY